MINISRLARLPSLVNKSGLVTNIRLSSHAPAHHHHQAEAIKYVSRDNYSVPCRPVTMDDMMVPYGSFQQALEAERDLANKTLAKGILMFIAGCVFFYKTGVADELWMPNLDNIMEETEPEVYDKEGRVTV